MLDHMAKPFIKELLVARISAHLQSQESKKTLELLIKEQTFHLKRAKEEALSSRKNALQDLIKKLETETGQKVQQTDTGLKYFIIDLYIPTFS